MEKNNNKLVIFLLIIIICLLSGGGFLGYKLLFNQPNSNVDGSNNNNQHLSGEENISYKNPIILYENTDEVAKIYLANETEYLKNGTKKEVISNAIREIETLNNKIYYIDREYNLNVYNIDEEKNEKYTLSKNSTGSGLYQILPGEDYTLIYNTVISSNFIRIDMKTKAVKALSVETDNVAMHFDHKTNMLYYLNKDNDMIIPDSSIRKYDVKTEKNIEVIFTDRNITILGADDEYVYLGLNSHDETSSDTLRGYSKKTNKLTNLYNRPYISGVSSVTDLIKVNNALYQIRNDDKAIIKYSNGNYSYICEGDYLYFVNVGNKIYIRDNVDYSAVDGWTDIKYYEYDTTTGKTNTLTNTYAIELFNYWDVIYNNNHKASE